MEQILRIIPAHIALNCDLQPSVPFVKRALKYEAAVSCSSFRRKESLKGALDLREGKCFLQVVSRMRPLIEQQVGDAEVSQKTMPLFKNLVVWFLVKPGLFLWTNGIPMVGYSRVGGL